MCLRTGRLGLSASSLHHIWGNVTFLQTQMCHLCQRGKADYIDKIASDDVAQPCRPGSVWPASLTPSHYASALFIPLSMHSKLLWDLQSSSCTDLTWEQARVCDLCLVHSNFKVRSHQLCQLRGCLPARTLVTGNEKKVEGVPLMTEGNIEVLVCA